MNETSERDFDAECPFCRIARGVDSSVEIVAESDSWVAFLPDTPATAGHTLVIPRTHVRNLWEVSPALGTELIGAVVRVGRAIRQALERQAEGLNLITSAGRAAEQTVFHLHLHVVPRETGDRIGRIWPPKEPMSEAVEESIAQRIRDAFANLD